MYVKELLHAWYIHRDEHAHNFSSPGGGSNSLKWTSVEGEGVHVKWTGTNKWGERSKTESLEGTYFLNDPKPLEVLRWNFDPVNKISLRLKQTKKQKYFLHMHKYLILKIGQILETNYHIFGILNGFLVCHRHAMTLKLFLSMSSWQKKLTGDIISNFCWLQQKINVWSVTMHQSRYVFDNITKHYATYILVALCNVLASVCISNLCQIIISYHNNWL